MKRILLAAASLFVLLTGNSGNALADCAAAPLASTSDMVVSFLAANGTQAAPSTALASSVKEGMLIYDNTADALKICNGTTWQTLAVGGGGVTAAGTVAGAVQFRGSGGNLAADDTNFVWDDTNDKLGIGTVTPFAKLSVNSGASPYTIQAVGTTQASFMLSGTYGQVYNGAGDLYLTNNGANAIIFRLSGSTETMRISNTGAIGIGSATPNASALLDVTSTSKGFLPPRMTTTDVGNIATPADGLMVYDTDTDTIKLRANGAWVSLMGGAGSEADPQVGTLTATKWCAANAGGTAIDCTVDAPATGAAGAANEVQFRNSGTGAFAANASFVWDNTNARLGVGATAPNAALEVQRAGFPVTIEQRNYVTDANTQRAVSAIVLANTTAAAADGFGPSLRFDIIDNTTGTDITTNAGLMADIGAVRAGANNSAALVFRTNNAGTLAEKVRIDKDGKVGIGTNNPQRQLELAGATAGTSAVLRLNKSDANAAAVIAYTEFGGSGAGWGRTGWVGDGNGVEQAISLFGDAGSDLRLGANAAEVVRILSASGNVGIGTAGARAKLEVDGNVRLQAGAPVNDTPAFGLSFEDNGDTGLFMTNNTSAADGDVNLYANSVARLTVLGSGANVGFIGIGTTMPASLLHVAGGIQLGDDAASCVAGKYGTLRYNASNLQMCGSSGWNTVGSAGGSSFMQKGLSTTWAVTASTVMPFNTVTNSYGSNITSSGNQMTLKAGSSYMLLADVRGGSVANEAFDFQWYNVTAGAAIGNVASESDGTNLESTAVAFIRPNVDTTVELRSSGVAGTLDALVSYSYASAIELGGGSGGGGGGGGTPGGATTQVQFNDGGAFGGDSAFVWDKTNDRVGLNTATPDARLSIRSGGASIGGAFPSDIWSQTSMIAIGNSATGSAAQGLIGHQGSHELDIFWNFYRKTDSSYTGLAANAYTSANGIRMGNAGIQFVGMDTIGTTMPPTNMTILNAGNVGIGTTTPAQKLDVVGTATANGVILKPAAGAAAPSAGTQVWDSDGTHAWRATGNVGIGAASPSYKLHVTGDGYITVGLGVGVAPASTIGVYSLKTGTNADGHGVYGYGNKVATASGTYYSAGSYNVARSTISSGVTDSGWIMGSNVSSLRATAGDAGTLAAIYGTYINYGHHSGATSSPTTTNAYGIYVSPSQQTGTITSNYNLYLAGPTTGGTVTNNFGVYQASTAQKNYFAGNVGIGSGTTSPAYTLDVTGTARATGNYYTNGSLYMGQDGTSTVLYGSSAANQYMSMYAASTNATGASIVLYGRTYSTTEGRISYYANTNTNDTTISHYFLKINSSGTGTALATIRSNGNMYVNGDYTCTIGIATTVSCSSDRRLKTNIEPFTGGLDSIVKLQPVTFKLKNPEKSQRQRMGFIAQDVEKIFPQAIDRDDQTDYLTMDYAMLVAPLVDAVKELNTKRLDLEAKVAAQGTEIETLKTQNADILKRLEVLEMTKQ